MLSQNRKLTLLRRQAAPPAALDDAYPEEVRRQLQAARSDLFAFCRLRNPQFYRSEREYLVRLCRELQEFYESDDLVMLVNLPPRHGKSYTAENFAEWVFGQDPSCRIMTGSYNEDLSQTFARAVRNAICEDKAQEELIIYRDIFPGVHIRYGDASAKRWSLEGQATSYLATSPGGTATGFGATLLIVDDLIKNAEEAFNKPLLEKQWRWFTDTMLSRLEEGGKILIIMTRWAQGDLAGRAEKHFAGLGVPVRKIVMPAVGADGRMLCPDVLSAESYRIKVASMSPEIASANYQQIPLDIQGRLYSRFATYEQLPELGRIYAYVDSADTGADYLCAIVWGVYRHEAYVLDVLYTKDPMEITEPATARLLDSHSVALARIESNNGGRGFARAVRRQLEEALHNYRTQVRTFTQHKNKQARILSNTTWIMEHVHMPADWRHKWPDYYEAMSAYQREGRGQHDDAPDATTGIVETMQLEGDI